MKSKIRSWSIRISAFVAVCFTAIVLTVLSPGLLYAKTTVVESYTVYHDETLPTSFDKRLSEVHELISTSELYDSSFQLKLCLNDGSFYPTLLEVLRGPAFGWGYLNISTFRGQADYEKNTITINGYNWNLTQLYAHEITHCLQTMSLGILQTNPFAGHDHWKWEGYPEYIARKNQDQLSLVNNIRRYKQSVKNDPKAWGIFFDDGTVSPRSYYRAWIMVQFCMEEKHMTYKDLLKSSISEQDIEQEMMAWYSTALDTNMSF
ncbi:MAG: hypothetical protein AAF789_12490 [Bacteroidota bacterium]